MTSPKEDQQPMTTREELVGLADRISQAGTIEIVDADLIDRNFSANERNMIVAALRLASRQEVSVTVETQRLADAMWQLLDDMGTEGKTVCLAAKAGARVAYEPFRDKSEPEYDDWMSLADAERILKECGQ